MRSYLYKIISDRGGAPCAPPPVGSAPHLLTLAICKPAIRRTAQPGDRIFGISSRVLEAKEGYAPASVLYSGLVAEALPAQEYYAAASIYRGRPDCIYRWEPEDGAFVHTGESGLHAHPEHMRKDLGGRFSGYPNGRVLLLRDFRYFGPQAQSIPEALPLLHRMVAALGQGHRVFERGKDAAIDAALDSLFQALRRRRGTASPAEVNADSYDHVLSAAGRREARQGRTAPCEPCRGSRAHAVS